MGVPLGNFDNLDALSAGALASNDPPPPAAAPFESKTLPPAISFTPVGAPSVAMEGFYITPDDSVQLTVWNSNAALASVTLQLRILRPDGTLVVTAATLPNLTADRTANTLSFSQLEGFLVGAVVGPPGVALARGSTFVNLAVVRGTSQNPLMSLVLLADYLSSAFQPGWPGGQRRSAVDGAGLVISPQGTVPPPNADAHLVVPANTLWRVNFLSFAITTDAHVSNRVVGLGITTPSGLVWSVGAPATQPASIRYFYSFAAGVNWQSADPTQQISSLPPNLLLPAGSSMDTSLLGGGLGDQVSAITAIVEEWIDV